MNLIFYIPKIMKLGVKIKIRIFIRNLILATLYFVSFVCNLWCTMYVLDKYTTSGSYTSLAIFILGLILTISCIILFLSVWEDIFEIEHRENLNS